MALPNKSNLGIFVNGVLIPVVPNSVVYNNGYSEVTVKSASIGGGAATSVHSENVENKFSVLKFKVYPQDPILALFPAWKAAIAANTCSGVDRTGAPFTMIGASFVNNPDIPPTPDGEVEIEFRGDPNG